MEVMHAGPPLQPGSIILDGRLPSTKESGIMVEAANEGMEALTILPWGTGEWFHSCSLTLDTLSLILSVAALL